MGKEAFNFKIDEDHKLLIEKLKDVGKIDSISSFIRAAIREKLRRIQEEKKI